MSDKKTRETDKIKFFEVGTEGEIRPAFPESSEREAGHEGDMNAIDSLIVDRLSELKPQIDTLTGSSRDLTSEEAEILKRYLSLREAEATDLRVRERQYKDYVHKLRMELAGEMEKNRDLLRDLDSRMRGEQAAGDELVRFKAEMDERVIRFEEEQKANIRAKEALERELSELERRKEEWKSRVTEDLRRIRLKERELETKHELLRRDSQALLDSKDKHLLEIKRKCDALELETEALEGRLREKAQKLSNMEARRQRLTETLRLALTLLDGMDKPE